MASRLAIAVLLAGLAATQPASAVSFAEIKPATQLRVEAARYDEAVKAMNAIAAMRIATPAEFADARKLFDAHAGNLRHAAARLAVLGHQDRRYARAVAALLVTPAAAQAFAQQLAADHRYASRLDGAADLRTRMASTLQANTAAYQRALDAMHAAALRLGIRIPGVQPKFFSPPDATLWNPTADVILAVIALTFPAIANDAAASTGITVAPPSQAAFLERIRSQDLLPADADALKGLQFNWDAYDAVRQTYHDIVEAMEATCIDEAKAKRDLCHTDATRLRPREQAAAHEACDWSYTMDAAMCRSGIHHGECTGILCVSAMP